MISRELTPAHGPPPLTLGRSAGIFLGTFIMDRYFITPSGRSVRIIYDQLRPTPHHDSLTLDLNVSSTSTVGAARICIDAPPLTAAAYRQATGVPMTEQVRDELVVLAVVNAVDQDPNLIGAPGEPFEVVIHPGNVTELGASRKLTDGELRRWLARRVYDEYSRTDLDVLVSIDDLDLKIAGASAGDVWRNAQLLGEEEYFRIDRGMGIGNYTLRPTPKLIREVERYGSARDDVVSEADFEVAVDSYALLASRREEIVPEYRRFRAASTSQEVASVFRAIAPTVEAVTRDLLRARGCTKDLPTLGPMIAELQSRGIGDSALYSQLNHVLKFARDLEQHGRPLHESVGRTAVPFSFPRDSVTAYISNELRRRRR